MPSPRARVPAPVWDVEIPAPRVRKLDLLYVVNHMGEDLHILSDRADTLCTHWCGGRTVFCNETKDGPCDLDHRETGRPRFAAWLAVAFPGTKKAYLLRLTEVAVRHEPALVARSSWLRGRLLHVWREAENEKAEMYAALSDAAAVQNLPPCPDVRAAVLHMIEADDRHEAQDPRRPTPFRKALNAWERKKQAIERQNVVKLGGQRHP